MKRERVKLRIVGERIKSLRSNIKIQAQDAYEEVAVGMTQEQFAEKMDVSLDTVKNWEQGYNYPTIDMLVKIADFFHCDFDYLLGKQQEPNKEYQYIEEYTGLSTEAVSNLIELKKFPFFPDTLSDLLDEDNIHVLLNLMECCTTNYGSVSGFVEMPDIFQREKQHYIKISPGQLRRADSLVVYDMLCDFMDTQRKKHGLPTSEEL